MLFGPATMSPAKNVSVDVCDGRMATLWRSLSLLSKRMVKACPAGTARQSVSNLWSWAVSARDVPDGEHGAPGVMFISSADAGRAIGPPALSTAATATAPSHLPMVSPLLGGRLRSGPTSKSVSGG